MLWCVGRYCEQNVIDLYTQTEVNQTIVPSALTIYDLQQLLSVYLTVSLLETKDVITSLLRQNQLTQASVTIWLSVKQHHPYVIHLAPPGGWFHIILPDHHLVKEISKVTYPFSAAFNIFNLFECSATYDIHFENTISKLKIIWHLKTNLIIFSLTLYL